MKFTSAFFVILISYSLSLAQATVTISGLVRDGANSSSLEFVNVVLKTESEQFITGTVTNADGRFTLSKVKPGTYSLELSFVGYHLRNQKIFVGTLSNFIDLGTLDLEEDPEVLQEVLVTAKQESVSEAMDRKTYTVESNISQSGGSVLQAMQNLPGVTVQDGKVLLRGNDRVIVLMDGKQTALTGFGNQTSLDNIPASAIEKIEIINNPSAKYEANGNAGIINIIYKKEKQEGLTGKAGIGTGLGALWVRKENLPTIRPQYQQTPKINPSLSLNYRKDKLRAFFQGDYLYTETLNKNEFVTRNYDDGTVIRQQTKRNRNTGFLTTKAGIDLSLSDHDVLTISGLYGSEKIIDHGDEPFFNSDLSQRLRLWQFLEDELKTTVMATSNYVHQYQTPGHTLSAGFNYTFHRENEKYFFDNIQPTFTGEDAFKLISDESVFDTNLDIVRPLPHGRIEYGLKFRFRTIPTDMQFFPGLNSPLDTGAGGKATYNETIPAAYANYVLESERWEAELGLRAEYVKVRYEVDPNHNTYKSDGYQYTQPFPNFRLSYKFNENNKLSLFANRRVDRPNEVDIRIFPKYDDVEVIKVGNPALQPQFTNSLELGFRKSWNTGYLFAAGFFKMANGTITRIASIVPGSTLIYNIFQNAGKSYNTGTELVLSQDIGSRWESNVNVLWYYNQINAFTVDNLYPQPNTFSAPQQHIYSGNVKWNNLFHLTSQWDLQLTAIYLAPDLIPQGRIEERFSLDLGLKKAIQKGKGELYLNATDLLNTMIIRKSFTGAGFTYTTADYYETQVVRLGYNYKF